MRNIGKINKMRKKITIKFSFLVILSLIISMLIFSLINFICEKEQWLKTLETDYSASKYNKISEFQEVINSAYGMNTEKEALQSCYNVLTGQVYVVDERGVIVFSEEMSGNINVDEYIKLVSDISKNDGNWFAYYSSFMWGKELYYIFQFDELLPVYRYTKVRVYLVAGSISAVFFFLFVLFFIRKKMRYIKYLSDSAIEISKGDLDVNVNVIGEDEFAVVAENINKMEENLRKKIEEKNRQTKTYKELVTNMSHDLKTPLTVILGYLDIARNDRCESKEQKDKYLDIAYEKALSLQKMIVNLFELVKSEQEEGGLALQKVNLTLLLKQYIAEYECAAEERGITLSSNIKSQFTITTDLQKATRIFNNVFENSLKYCDDKGSISVDMADEPSTVLIDISNTSKTIEDEELERIFEQFYRCDPSRNGATEGNGIGLSTVKKMVEIMNGRVWAEYHETRFHLKIRLQKEM